MPTNLNGKSNFKEIIALFFPEISQKTKELHFNPWARFLARRIDLIVITSIMIISTTLFYPDFIHASILKKSLLMILVSYPTWVIIEAILLSTWGTTPGKFIFNLQLTDLNNSKLKFNAALGRSLNVWMKGMGFGLPLITIITFINSYDTLKKNSVTAWDKNKFILTHKKIGFIRWMVILIVVIFVISSQIQYVLNCHK